MTNDQLGLRARSLVEAACLLEPGLDDAAEARMRCRLLGVVTGAVMMTTATTVGAASGIARALAGSGTASGGVTGIAALGTSAKLLVLCVLVGASLGGATWALRTASSAAEPSAHGSATARPPAHDDWLPAAPPAAPAATATATPVRALPAAPATNVGELPAAARRLVGSIVSAPPVSVEKFAPTLASSSPAPPTPAGPSEAPTGETPLDAAAFTRELRALDRARQALATGDAPTALAETDAPYATRAFAEERAAVHAVALCKAGRRDEGQREVARFRSDFPRSIHFSRAARACGDSDVTDPVSGGHSPK